ncbi:MAG: hypothetical protein RML33_06280 [Acidobacteriota bacterium]|nr:hypothetical protein [Pyrinomonadaceae bacterium]MDW8304423.1 hypothetical protein [Acidobacteriota bacterium]
MIPEQIKDNLPDIEQAERFINLFLAEHGISKLTRNKELLADVLTLASYSPFLGNVILQNPNYITWLSKQRKEPKVRNKEELLESLARFRMTNFDLPLLELFNRFKQREFLRIYLDDIKRLKTIAEVTEEIADLADAILENALRFASQEMNDLYGIPLEKDPKGRTRIAEFCIVALGKLGSKELNYASDIDLMFLYSGEGATSGTGAKGTITNREYFVKLSEKIIRLVSGGISKNGAYRIDLRLRPHGRVGAIAVTVTEAVNYYKSISKLWERQALIRARLSAGDASVFKSFYEEVVELIFPTEISVREALESVRLSKEKINFEHRNTKGFNVKLGKGGIRDIEFIAQALQIVYGGKDFWVRSPHTLIALSRLADRELISMNELRQLSNAYTFLRRLEHHLQMEHGLQTHTVPDSVEKKQILARKMHLSSKEEFESKLAFHTQNVTRIFERVFTKAHKPLFSFEPEKIVKKLENKLPARIVSILGNDFHNTEKLDFLEHFCQTSPYLSEMLTSKELILSLIEKPQSFEKKNFTMELLSAVKTREAFSEKLSILRKAWSKLFLEIAVSDILNKISYSQAKLLQTELADASIFVALEMAKEEAFSKANVEIFGLGKLGGKGMDYGSDLDLIFVSDTKNQKVCELILKVLSNFTREGNLYRVDLRLRPYGKDGAICISENAFLEYLESKSAIWEWLAYVKLRGILSSSKRLELEAKSIIYERAKKIHLETLKTETRRIRHLLEQKVAGRKDFNIKFSFGGKLDVYFAMRFLQLKDAIFDDEQDRSTLTMLKKLYVNGSLTKRDFEAFYNGYNFLNQLDHLIRLTVGPTNYVPLSNQQAIRVILERMQLKSVEQLREHLLFHRLEIHKAFERVLEE